MPALFSVSPRNLLLLCSVLTFGVVPSLLALSQADAELQIEFLEYRSPKGTLSDGSICDPDFKGNVQSDCDPSFEMEIFKDGGKGDPLFSMKQGNYYENLNILRFGSAIGPMPNPKTLDMVIQEPGNIYLRVTVEDYDRSRSNQLMDIFVFKLKKLLTLQTVDYASPTTTNSLRFTYKFTCKPDLYGPLCAKHCKEATSDADGHFTCSPDGEKICKPGWMNVDEDCRVPDWCRWC